MGEVRRVDHDWKQVCGWSAKGGQNFQKSDDKGVVGTAQQVKSRTQSVLSYVEEPMHLGLAGGKESGFAS
jgi:hypothetical protein